MASHGTARSDARAGGSGAARAALVDAAARLLVERPPTAISGRELATEAGVNYGLVHHYFGGKDAALAAGLEALRQDFVRRHGGEEEPGFLAAGSHPYFKALVRSQVDYPDAPRPDGDFPGLARVVAALEERLAKEHPDLAPAARRAEAKARAIAAVSLQITYGVFSAALLDAARVGHRERRAVERHLHDLHAQIALRASPPPAHTAP